VLDKTDDISVAAESWLAQFESALANARKFQALFHSESYWRDVLALSWNIQTVNGADAILPDQGHMLSLATAQPPSSVAVGFKDRSY
jgi:hypothetical protein